MSDAQRGPVRPRDRFLVFGAPLVGEPEIAEVVASLRSGWLGTGPKVARFEEEFRAYKGAAHAVAVNSCTAALHLSLLAAGIGPGDEVLVPALTFCATANVVIHTGATPIPVDVESRTMNLDVAQLAASIGPRTRAIVPVHFAGRPCDLERIGPLAQAHSLVVVEDCAHAVETEDRGRKAGTVGDFGCFSFYVTKNVMTGEGGMILTASDRRAARLKVLALHGLSQDAWKRYGDEGFRHYQVVEAGFKYNMMDLQAALGLHQLRRVEASWARRRAVWARYDQAFAALPVERPAPWGPEVRHGLHLYTLLVDERRSGLARDAFLAGMTAQGVGVGVHYLALAEHPYYQARFGWRPEAWPTAMRLGRQTVSLPLSARLTDDDVEDVIEAVRRVLGG